MKICDAAAAVGQTVLRACAPGHRIPAFPVEVEQPTALGRHLHLSVLKEPLGCM